VKGISDRTWKKISSHYPLVWEVRAESRFHPSRLPSENDPRPTTHGPRAAQNARSLSFVRLHGNTRWHHWQLVRGAERRRVQKIKHPCFQIWVQFRIVEVDNLPCPFSCLNIRASSLLLSPVYSGLPDVDIESMATTRVTRIKTAVLSSREAIKLD
jgi:hypothetical protein